MLNKTKKKLDFSITLVILIGILIAVNFLSYQLFYRMDITQNKDYSISKVSKKTAGSLDDIVSIKAYFSSNLPSQYINVKQEVGDILGEYANYSNGNIKVEFIDPQIDEETERDLYMKGIPALQFNVLEQDKYQAIKGYMGVLISYGDKSETIPAIQDTANLEYQITTAIKKVTSDQIARIGYVTSNDTNSLESEMSQAYGKLQELYSVQEVDLTTGSVPQEISTLVIAGPKSSFGDKELQAINKFVMGGGKLLVLVDMVKVDKNLAASANETNISTLLEKYRIKLNKDLVLDVSSGVASFSQGFFTFSTNYPFWPKVEKGGFDEQNASVANLESVIFPWVSSIDILKAESGDSTAESLLANTTSEAWHMTDNYDISPQGKMTPTGDKKRFSLAVMVTGRLASAYPDQKDTPKETDDGRIIAVGDSDFATDNFVQNNSDNLVLFQNLVDSLSLDSDLINIRSKGITSRPIVDLGEPAKAAYRYGNIFGVTIIVILFGMLRYYLRRKQRFMEGL